MSVGTSVITPFSAHPTRFNSMKEIWVGARAKWHRRRTSDGSVTEKVGFGWVREFSNFENSGLGISAMEKVGFGRELKSRVSGIFGF